MDQVKDIEFFKNIDFVKLKRQEVKSPFIPEVVKFNYNKELNNVSKPFNTFILDEKIENHPNNTSKELVYYYDNEKWISKINRFFLL